jgi:hypothetical protein
MNEIQRSTLQLLRLPFSFFLMPVYWFALSQVVDRELGPGAADLYYSACAGLSCQQWLQQLYGPG